MKQKTNCYWHRHFCCVLRIATQFGLYLSPTTFAKQRWWETRRLVSEGNYPVRITLIRRKKRRGCSHLPFLITRSSITFFHFKSDRLATTSDLVINVLEVLGCQPDLYSSSYLGMLASCVNYILPCWLSAPDGFSPSTIFWCSVPPDTIRSFQHIAKLFTP